MRTLHVPRVDRRRRPQRRRRHDRLRRDAARPRDRHRPSRSARPPAAGSSATPEGRAAQRVSRPPFTLPGRRGRGRRGRVPRARGRAGRLRRERRRRRRRRHPAHLPPRRRRDRARAARARSTRAPHDRRRAARGLRRPRLRPHLRADDGARTAPSSRAGASPTGDAPTAGGPRRFGISGDGRYVVFASARDRPPRRRATTPTADDVFVYDRVTETTERVSEAFGGGDPNGDVLLGRASRATAATSRSRATASNLVATPDANGMQRRLRARPRDDTTELVSVAYGGGFPTGDIGTTSGASPTTAASSRSRRARRTCCRPAARPTATTTSSSATAASRTAIARRRLHAGATRSSRRTPAARARRRNVRSPSAATASGSAGPNGSSSDVRAYEPRHRRDSRSVDVDVSTGGAGGRGAPFIGGISLRRALRALQQRPPATCSRPARTRTATPTSSSATGCSASPSA